MCPDSTCDPHSAAEATPTSTRLLDAAERLFAERGFDGTSVRDITAAAECNIASVNYHFGSKDKLYLAVFQRRLGALREQRISSLDQALAEAGDRATIELVVSTFTAAFLEPLATESEGRLTIELFAREMMSPHLPPGVLVNEMVHPVQHALARALQTVCPELDETSARRCGLSLVAQLVHVIHARRMLADPVANPRSCLELNLDRDLDLASFVDHINRFTAGGIRALLGGAQS